MRKMRPRIYVRHYYLAFSTVNAKINNPKWDEKVLIKINK